MGAGSGLLHAGEMSSDEEKSRSPILPKDSVRGSSVSSDLQDEYEELLCYAVVTPRFELCTPKQSEPCSELRERGRSSSVTDDTVCCKAADLLSVKECTEVNMEQLHPVSEETSSQESTHVPRETDETTATELTVPDEKVTQIENILDLWSGSLKTNVLSELRKWRLSFIEHHKHQMRQEKEKHAEHVKQLSNEIDNLKELLRTYEISIGRKDEVIMNMTEALERKKERIELMRKFTLWRIQQIKAKQEVHVQNKNVMKIEAVNSKSQNWFLANFHLLIMWFHLFPEEYANRIADKQFQTALKKKVWTAWCSLREERWKEKVTKACQLRAEDICVQLTNDYEAKIAEV
ncbi:hypothetical protein ASZ78_004245 [Callipepla squamata]|uniref:Centrosomal protein POC5 n=1 Tax=Callipepla squamata TaxID=9009 RepID=A0A226NFD2_CALSU|nr:hypothetical protein ASZ78_004245 [Callipepla squamata]